MPTENFCALTNSQTDDFDWIRGRNGTNSTATGPSIDHTMGTDFGYFAYINAAGRYGTTHASLDLFSK